MTAMDDGHAMTRDEALRALATERAAREAATERAAAAENARRALQEQVLSLTAQAAGLVEEVDRLAGQWKRQAAALTSADRDGDAPTEGDYGCARGLYAAADELRALVGGGDVRGLVGGEGEANGR